MSLLLNEIKYFITASSSSFGLVAIHAADDVLQYIAGNSRMHVKTSMKSVKDRFMKAPYGFVEDDVQWLIAKLFKRGDLSFSVNGASAASFNDSVRNNLALLLRSRISSLFASLMLSYLDRADDVFRRKNFSIFK